jgi:glutathione peroxidase
MNIYAIEALDITNKPFDMSALRGKVTLVVNVASACGFTPQYADLQAMHEELSGRGFSVLGVPSNDFGGQEPGSASEIIEFCRTAYAVTFPLLQKSRIKSGPDQSPLYAALSQASGSLPGWNFGKYVIGREGQVLAFFGAKVAPRDPSLREAIEAALTAD